MSLDQESQSMAPKPVFHGPEVTKHLLAGRGAFHAYFRRKLGSPQEAEDAFQDFALKVLRAARSPDHAEKIDAWLGRILRNTLIDHYRRRAVRRRVEAAYAQEMQVSGAEAEDVRDQSPCRCIGRVLAKLKPDQADILRRADLEEEPRSRIAADLGLTSNNLNVRLHRARLALKGELQRSCPACRTGSFLDCECG